MVDENDQDLETLEEETEELESEDTELEESEEDSSEETESQTRGGDLRVALRKERDEKRKLAADLDEMRKAQERQETLLKQLGQPKQEQPDPTKYNQQLQDALFENPSQVLGHYANQAEQRALQRMAPLQIQQQKAILAAHPDYKDVYARPSIRAAMDKYIEDSVQASGIVDPESIDNAMRFFVDIYQEFGAPANPKPSTKGKEKLTSTVNKGSGKAPQTGTDEEVWAKALKKKPKDYLEWETKPENQALVIRVLKARRSTA